MFCGECGAKLEKGAEFCAECGARVPKEESVKKTKQKDEVVAEPVVEENTQTVPATPPKPKKPMSKSMKIGLIVGAVVVVALFAGYQILNGQFSPSNVASEFMNAWVAKDADKLYDYYNFGDDTTFVSKEKFKNYFESEMSDTSEVTNYQLSAVRYSNGGLNATITAAYTTKDASKASTMDITLVKEKDKKLLLFDSWKVAMDSDEFVVNNFEVRVPKGSKLYLDGTEVDTKYINTEESTTSLDVYEIPAIFEVETEIKTETPMGITIVDKETPTEYDVYTARYSLDQLSEEQVKVLQDQVKADINSLYKNVIDKKTWDNVKESYNYDGADLSRLKSDYDSLYRNIADYDYTVLTAFNVTKVTINSLDDEDGRLSISVKIDYDYTVTYDSYLSGAETHSSSSNYSTTIDYDYVDGKYHLYDLSYNLSYFSRYS